MWKIRTWCETEVHCPTSSPTISLRLQRGEDVVNLILHTSEHTEHVLWEDLTSFLPHHKWILKFLKDSNRAIICVTERLHVRGKAWACHRPSKIHLDPLSFQLVQASSPLWSQNWVCTHRYRSSNWSGIPNFAENLALDLPIFFWDQYVSICFPSFPVRPCIHLKGYEFSMSCGQAK